MVGFSELKAKDSAVAVLEQTMQLGATTAARGLAKYRHTILFAVTALVIIATAATFTATKVNSVIAGLAEKQIIDLAEENSARDALHIQSMITGGQGMLGMNQDSASMEGSSMGSSSDGYMSTESGDSMPLNGSGSDSSTKSPLTLDLLIGPMGLPTRFADMVEGLGVVESSLFSPAGEIVWSTDPGAVGRQSQADLEVHDALAGTVSSKLVTQKKFVQPDGTIIIMDAVQTHVPLRESPTSPVVGVLEIYRDVGTNLGQLVDDTKSTVVWTTVAAMAGLFLALLGFVVVSDRVVYRSNRAQLDLMARRLEEAEHAQALESSNHELANQLARSEKLATIGQLSGGMAHDLRNPLGSIKNAAYMLKKGLTTDGVIEANPKLKRYIEIIDQQVIRSNETITELMNFANVATPTLVETRLDEVLHEALETMVKNDNIELVMNFDTALDPVMADGEQLQRAFLNLANNAQEAMPGGGRLTITIKGMNDHVEIIFSDTGEGITDENIGKIFDPLFTTKVKGTGLGLAVCLEIFERHGGTISARQNDGPSGGTTFYVTLPAQRPSEGELTHDA